MSDAVAGKQRPVGLSYRHALRFILLVGTVSLFADMTYEGARSITGPYLAVLGASATAVGFVAGFGELIGYAMRLASGYLSDRTGRYWAVTIFGYCANLLAVPLLALAGSWEAAAELIVLERMGRAISTPARDAMLSHASHRSRLGLRSARGAGPDGGGDRAARARRRSLLRRRLSRRLRGSPDPRTAGALGSAGGAIALSATARLRTLRASAQGPRPAALVLGLSRCRGPDPRATPIFP
jgi:hypothetical protein